MSRRAARRSVAPSSHLERAPPRPVLVAFARASTRGRGWDFLPGHKFARRSPDVCASIAGMNGGWNHNIQYHAAVLDSVPADAHTALDVGCGEGLLTRRLRRTVPHVVGIDIHEPSIAQARYADDIGIEYVVGDFLTHPFEAESFDFIASVASLHHMDVGVALERMRQLLRIGGRLAVVGCARSRQAVDLPVDLAGVIAHRWHTRAAPSVEDGSPKVWPPSLTYGQTRRLATRALPGATYRRRLLWRYTLTWTKRR